ncbi:hypothetical protein Tco_0894348 [Tanacetum coccineum]|uniref:Uncharacterized protein n=1 Tax=Tanacetum coccineum TaxID=301880 RepID=A0ABQ5CBF3_9ASTR
MSMEALQAREDLMRSIENFLNKFNRISFRETPKFLMQAWDKFLEIKHAQSEEVQESLSKLVQDVQNISDELAEYINTPAWNRPLVYCNDDDEDCTIAITPVLPTKEPVNSLSMGDEHLDTIPATESDEFIKFSVENLVPTPSEFEDFSDGECDLPPYDDSSKNHDLTFSNPLFDIDEDCTSSDESFSEEDVPNENFKIFSNPLFDLDEKITSAKVDQTHDEVLDNIKSIPPRVDNINLDSEGDILFLKSLLYDNSSPRPPEAFQANADEIDLSTGSEDSIPPGIENDDFDSEDDDNSSFLPECESFHVDYLDSGNSTIDVVEDIPVDVPDILPTQPTLHMDFNFIPSHNDLGSDLDGSSPSEVRNKIYDSGICFEVKSTRSLATLSPVIDKVFNHGVHASKEKSTPSSSHRDLKASKLFHHENPLLIHGDNTSCLSVCHPYFYPP